MDEVTWGETFVFFFVCLRNNLQKGNEIEVFLADYQFTVLAFWKCKWDLDKNMYHWLISGNFLPTTSVFTADEYRAWLSRTPSTSAIYDKLKSNRDNSLLRQKNRFTFSAENLPERTRQVLKTWPCS